VLFDDEPGYRIDRREYALPQISFAADELAVLGLASRHGHRRAWQVPQPRLCESSRAAGVEA
jgi:proteasome accessory factor B